MPLSTVTRWIAPAGRWQRVLPGVVAAHNGTITRRQCRLGALAYSGPDALLSGLSGLRMHRLRAAEHPGDEVVHTLVPHERRRSAHQFAVVERTRHLPSAVVIQGVRVAPLARCLVDACRREPTLEGVREMVVEAVQSGRCPPRELVVAVQQANRQRTGLVRRTLNEIAAGLRSVAEIRVSEAVLASDLPVPLFNPRLYLPDGTFIASPDGYFEQCAAAYEVDSFAYHLSRESYIRTQRRQRRVMGHGVLSISVSPVDAYEHPAAFVEELRSLVAAAEQRPTPAIVVRRAATA